MCLISRDVLCTIGRSRSQVSIFRYLPIAGGAQIFYTSVLRVWHEYKLKVSIRGLAFWIKLVVKFFKIPFVNTTFRCTALYTLSEILSDFVHFGAECFNILSGWPAEAETWTVMGQEGKKTWTEFNFRVTNSNLTFI